MKGHIQAISRRFSKFGTSVQFILDQRTLNTLVALLSHSLQAAVKGNRTRISSRVDANGELEADLHEENTRKGRSIINTCELEEPVSAQHVIQLVTDVLEVTADLMLVRENSTSSTQLLTSMLTSIHLTTFSF